MATYDVFLAHNSSDRQAVEGLATELRDSRGLHVWFDEWCLRPGLSWQKGMEEGIRASRAGAVLIGKDGIGPWENEEMEALLLLATRHRLPVVPVLLAEAPKEPELPVFLATRRYVDLRHGQQAAGIDQLVWGITGENPHQAPTPRAPLPLDSVPEPSAPPGAPDPLVASDSLSPARPAIGLDPWALSPTAVLGETDHSRIERVSLGDRQLVRKRTQRSLCDVDALLRIAGKEFHAGGYLPVLLAAPLTVQYDENFVYEVYPYFEGITLRDVVRRNRHSLQGQVLGDFYNEALHALGELGQLGVVHRDVAPSNFLLREKGGFVLIDASFACRVDHAQVPIENRDYSAPEVRRGNAVPQSDWYSLANTVYYMAFGVSPHRRPAEEVATQLRKMDIGAYSSTDYIASLMHGPVEDRPTRSWQAKLDDQTSPVNMQATAILGLGELGYLILYICGYDIVPSSRIDAFLRRMLDRRPRRGVKPWVPEGSELREEIKAFLGGSDPWVR